MQSKQNYPLIRGCVIAAAVVTLAFPAASRADGADDLNFALGLVAPGVNLSVTNAPPVYGAYYAQPQYYAPTPPVAVYAPPPPPTVVYEPAAPAYYAPAPRRGPPPWAGVWRH